MAAEPMAVPLGALITALWAALDNLIHILFENAAIVVHDIRPRLTPLRMAQRTMLVQHNRDKAGG
jgi:hypothetical protein